ncbi:MAG: adenylyltransferase/cytidyltransferase family protein [Leptolyngbyaceae cyanobacterium]
MKTYDICLCMGRFQPFHWGHFDLVQSAMEQGERVILLLGSHLTPPSVKNPWSSNEREKMIWQCLNSSERSRVQFIPICDFDQDEKWAATIHRKVNTLKSLESKIAIVSYHEEGDKFFSKHFPDWDYIEKLRRPDINATGIRAAYFSQSSEADYREKLPAHILQNLREFKKHPTYQKLCQECQRSHQCPYTPASELPLH